jgi:ornithine carbamoyltransferase
MSPSVRRNTPTGTGPAVRRTGAKPTATQRTGVPSAHPPRRGPRHFLTVDDLSPVELARCVELAARCKRVTSTGRSALAGRTIALVFQKPSIRTRVSFEVAITSLGGASTYLAPEDIQLDTREPIKDVARTLSRYVQGIVVRVFRHDQVEEFARYASVPVINGLSDLHHPCQALADLLTIRERFGRLKGLTVAYIGDGNNVLHSLAQAAAVVGLHVRVASPDRYRPDHGIWNAAAARGQAQASTLTWTSDPQQAVRGADVIYTDVWTSMGQEQERAARLQAFQGYQLNGHLLAAAKPSAIVLHCLPAHRGEEITDEVVEGPQSAVFDQAENRLHAQKALLLTLFGKS